MSTTEKQNRLAELSAELGATEPVGVARLRAAREALAALQAEQAATTAAAAPLRLPEPGSIVHCLVTGTTISTGQGWLAGGAVLNRGQNVVITAAMLDATRDAGGRYTGVALVNNPDAQLARHGRILFAPGEAPADMTFEPNTREWREAREAARTSAWTESDPARRAAALAEVERRFGPAPVTSTTISTTPDPSIALAEQQRARLDAGGVRHVNNYEAARR